MGFSYYCLKCRAFKDVETPGQWYSEGCPDCGKEATSTPFTSAIAPIAKDMALDTLNSKQNGMPDRHWRGNAEQKAMSGLSY